jgi:hypothetical protein
LVRAVGDSMIGHLSVPRVLVSLNQFILMQCRAFSGLHNKAGTAAYFLSTL